jgi:hypothetical protein
MFGVLRHCLAARAPPGRYRALATVPRLPEVTDARERGPRTPRRDYIARRTANPDGVVNGSARSKSSGRHDDKVIYRISAIQYTIHLTTSQVWQGTLSECLGPSRPAGHCDGQSCLGRSAFRNRRESRDAIGLTSRCFAGADRQQLRGRHDLRRRRVQHWR